MKAETFPAWAPRELVDEYLKTRLSPPLATTKISNDDDDQYFGLYCGMWVRPKKADPAREEYEEIKYARNKEWRDVHFRKLLLNPEAQNIWAMVEALNLEAGYFARCCNSAFEGMDYGDKLAYKTRAEKRKYYIKIRESARDLAALLAVTKYDFSLRDNVWRRLKTQTGDSLDRDFMGLLQFYGPRSLSAELEELAQEIDSDIDSGNYQGDNAIFDDEDDDFLPFPPLKTKHTSRQGHRAQFYRQLAFFMNKKTGNPRPTLVAATTRLIFSDLGDLIDAEDISRLWKG